MKSSFSFLFVYIILIVCSCKPPSNSDYGKNFIGIWEAQGIYNLKIEIKELVTNEKKREDRYNLIIIEKDSTIPNNYISEGQYNYWYVNAEPKDNRHPFKEFIHKNSFKDTIPYLGFEKDKNILIRKFKGLPDLKFKRLH